MSRQIKPLGVFKPTPRFLVYGRLRQIFLRSNERAYAIKRDSYTCQTCGKKQSKAKGREVKIHVHHIKEINDAWKEIEKIIYDKILVHPDGLKALCSDCHKGIKKIKSDNENSF
jgi:predicted HNH restriction endonuclease